MAFVRNCCFLLRHIKAFNPTITWEDYVSGNRFRKCELSRSPQFDRTWKVDMLYRRIKLA